MNVVTALWIFFIELRLRDGSMLWNYLRRVQIVGVQKQREVNILLKLSSE